MPAYDASQARDVVSPASTCVTPEHRGKPTTTSYTESVYRNDCLAEQILTVSDNRHHADIFLSDSGAGTKSKLQGQGELEAGRAEPGWSSWIEGLSECCKFTQWSPGRPGTPLRSAPNPLPFHYPFPSTHPLLLK